MKQCPHAHVCTFSRTLSHTHTTCSATCQARRHWGWARKAAITIQAGVRMWLARRAYCSQRRAAIQMQVSMGGMGRSWLASDSLLGGWEC